MSQISQSLSPSDIQVRMQPTPNPYVLIFIVSHAVILEGNATFHHPSEATELPLILSLFDVPGILQVYVFQNTMTLTHTGELDPEDIEEQVISIIKSRMPIHNPGFRGPETQDAQKPKKSDRSAMSPEIQMIEEILDRTIRPGLQSDGGDLELISFVDNELKILYQGACGGCPSATMGTLDAIQNILRQELKNPTIIVRPI